MTIIWPCVLMIIGSQIWCNALRWMRPGTETRQAVVAFGVILNAGGFLVAALSMCGFTDWVWLWAGAASMLGIGQVIPYIISILQGRTRPSRVGTGIWAAAELVALASYLAAGGSAGTPLQIGFAATGLAVFALALRSGVNSITKVDIACGLIAAGARRALLLGSPTVAVAASALATGAGFVSVVDKTWHMPGTENPLSWILTAIAAASCTAAIALQSDGPLLMLPAGVTLVGSLAVLIANCHSTVVEPVVTKPL